MSALAVTFAGTSAHADEDPAPAPYAYGGERKKTGLSRGTEALVGGLALGGGYLLGAAIFLVPAVDAAGDPYGGGRIENVDEKRLTLIPFAGPLLWWFVARPRIRQEAHREASAPYSDCNMCIKSGESVDEFFHYFPGLPFAILTSFAQVGGAALLVHAIARSDEPAPKAADRPARALTFAFQPYFSRESASIGVSGAF